MLEQTGVALRFECHYIENKVSKTGLTVTVDLYRNDTKIITGGSATEVGDGFYKYVLDSSYVTVEGVYKCVFKTATTTVDQQHLAAAYLIGMAGLEYLTADLATILADTNELQGDWANGGRLDLLADSILDDTTELTDSMSLVDGKVDLVLADTTELQTDDIPSLIAALPTEDVIADAVWEETRSDHFTPNTYGESFYSIESGEAVAGTLSTTQMTTTLLSGLNNQYLGRLIIWITGSLTRQVSAITAYDGPTKKLTFNAVTVAPSVGDRFIVV